MLKRLLTVVFVLSLLMALAGTAISGPISGVDARVTRQKAVPTRPAEFSTPKATTPVESAVPATMAKNDRTFTPSGTDTVACYLQNYYDNLTSGANIYTRHRLHASSRRFAMRMNGANQADHLTRVYGAIPYVYKNGRDASGDGTVGMYIGVYSDLGGVPNAMIAEQVFQIPPMAAPGGYVPVYFTTPVEFNAAAYHIVFSTDLASAEVDSITWYSDNAGTAGSTATATNRSSVFKSPFTPGTWAPALGFFSGGLNPNWDIYSDQCEIYSSCYFQDMIPAPYGVGLYSTPRNGSALYPGHALVGWGQKFFAAGPETVKTVEMYHYCTGTLYTGASTQSYTVEIRADNAGDPGALIQSIAIPGGAASLFGGDLVTVGWRTVIVNFAPLNVVVLGPYHICVQANSNTQTLGRLAFGLSDDAGGTDGSGGSIKLDLPLEPWQNTGVSPTWLAGGGVEVALEIGVNTCKDEFADCQAQTLYDDVAGITWSYLRVVPFAQRFTGKPVNRLEKIRFQSDWWSGTPYVKVGVWGDAGPLGPGAAIWDTVVAYADITWYPGWTTIVLPNGGKQINGDFYVSLEGPQPAATSPDSIIQMAECCEAGHVMKNGGMWRLISGTWVSTFVALGWDDNLPFDVEFCSVPVSRRICAPGEVWPTQGHDYARSSATNNAVGDAYCDLTFKWLFAHPTNLSFINGPIIYDTFVVSAFSNEYRILSLNTGLPAGPTLSGAAMPSHIGSSIQSTPTIATVDVAGTPTTLLFVAGGNNNAIMAYHFPPASATDTLWATNVSDGWRGLGNIGQTRFTAFTVLKIGGVDVLYFGSDGDYVFAVQAANGNAFAPWGVGALNKKAIGAGSGGVSRSGATDGTRMYFGSQTPGGNGDIYCFDAATGATVWTLSGSGGLKGTVVFSGLGAGVENFVGPLAVTSDDKQLYANSSMGAGNHPTDGVFYIINSLTGAVKSAVASNANYNAYGGPMVDQAMVFIPSRSRWVTSGTGGDLLSFNRKTGFLNWSVSGGADNGAGSYYSDGVLTCEGLDAGQVFVFSDLGYLSCFNGDNGSEIFSRRIDNGAAYGRNLGGGGAMAPGHLLFQTRWGQIIDLTQQVPRPRLEILHYNVQAPVPFNSPDPFIVTFPQMYTNTGCVALNVTSLIPSTTSNGSTVGAPAFSGYSNNLMDRSNSIANMLAANSSTLLKNVEAQTAYAFSTTRDADVTTKVVNQAASAVPIYLNTTSLGPYVVNQNDTMDIVISVKGPLVSRGPQTFYMEFTTDDPDFWLGTSTKKPEITLTLVGGCLHDTTWLMFGAGGANYQVVTNTGRMGTGDLVSIAPSNGNFKIGTAKADFYQGTYFYGVDSHRIAMNTQDWTTGGGEANAWVSLQADKNFCTNVCKPTIKLAVALGAASSNGITYTNMTGDLICKSYIDSVQNFDLGAGWNWRNWTASFDNAMTMGISAKTNTFAVKDAPAGDFAVLNNVTVEVMRFTERNGAAVNGWKFGSMIDYDIGSDTASIARSISTAWSCTRGKPATGNAMGQIKIPFGGCGDSPMKNVKALDAKSAQFATTAANHGSAYWDSAFYYMNLPAGGYSHVPLIVSASDQEYHATIAEHNFTPNGSVTFAVANFDLIGIANPWDSTNFSGLARLVNKWLGFGRGDVNNDGTINLADIVYLADRVYGTGPGAIPFEIMGDVSGNDVIDGADVTYLVNYYFNHGACPVGQFAAFATQGM